MPLGLSIYHSGGTFVPRIEYNAKAGRMGRVDQTADGNDYIKIDITMSQPMFAFDLGSIEIGWMSFQTGLAPSFSMVPYGQPMPERPDRGHKAGFRLKVWDGRETAPREFCSSAGATVNAIEAQWDAFERSQEGMSGKLPVLQFTNVVVIGRNYAPVFKLAQWIEREERIFGPRTVAAPGAPPIVPIASNSNVQPINAAAITASPWSAASAAAPTPTPAQWPAAA